MDWHDLRVSPAMFGVLSAISLGCADFIARYTSRALGHNIALLGTFIVTIVFFFPFFLKAPVISNSTWAEMSTLVFHGISMTAAMLLLYYSLSRGPLNLVLPIIAAHPVFVVLYAVVSGSAPSVIQWLMMVAIIISIVLVVVGAGTGKSCASNEEHSIDFLRKSAIIALVASVAYAAMIVSGQQVAPSLGAINVLWIGHVFAIFILLAYIYRTSGFIRPKMGLAFALIAQGLLNAAGFLFLFFGSNAANPEITAVISAEFSVVTILLAWVVLRERMSMIQFFGVVLLFSSTAVLTLAG